MKRYLEEVTERTVALAREPDGRADAAGLLRLRIAVPKVRALVKRGYSFFAQPPADVVAIWDHIWRRSPHYEVMSQALYYYQHKTLSADEIDRIEGWVDRCSCWEHGDDLSKIYALAVEERPERMLPLLRRWGAAACPWKRRQSLVSLLEYASKRRRVQPFDTLVSFIEPRLTDDDHYVQKAVGWTLREVHNVYPAETEGFLRKHLHAIDPRAWSAATQKLDKALKKQLNQQRRAGRRRST